MGSHRGESHKNINLRARVTSCPQERGSDMQTMKNIVERVYRRPIGIFRTIGCAQENQVGRQPDDPNWPTNSRVRPPNGHQVKYARILCMTRLKIIGNGKTKKRIVENKKLKLGTKTPKNKFTPQNEHKDIVKTFIQN